jgi:hypothetical protein
MNSQVAVGILGAHPRRTTEAQEGPLMPIIQRYELPL